MSHPLTSPTSKKGLAQGLALGEDQMVKSKLMLEHSLGLGHQPNVIPAGEPDIAGPLRTVEIGWHPVGGFGGKWFAEQTGLGKMITKEVKKYPDPTQHWAVLVEGYCHELWMVSCPNGREGGLDVDVM